MFTISSIIEGDEKKYKPKKWTTTNDDVWHTFMPSGDVLYDVCCEFSQDECRSFIFMPESSLSLQDLFFSVIVDVNRVMSSPLKLFFFVIETKRDERMKNDIREDKKFN